MKKALVSGGTGVTGNALIRHLLNKGVEVTALVRSNSTRKTYMPIKNRLTIIDVNLGDFAANADTIGSDHDAFFHLAWDGSLGKEKTDNRYHVPLQHKNADHALDAVALCKKINCPVFIMTGSQAEYGRLTAPANEQTPCYPENAYGAAKHYTEQMTRFLCGQSGIKHIWARLFSIYGPYDGAHSLVDLSIKSLLNGIRPQYTRGEQVWDYLYSFDAAEALFLLAEHGCSGETYCVANGNAQPLRDYIRIMHEVVNPQIEPVFGEIPYSNNTLMLLAADISKLKRDTNFAPQYSFEEGIKQICAYYAACADKK